MGEQALPLTVRIVRAGGGQAEAITAFGRRCYAAHYGDLWSAAGLHDYLDRQFDPDTVASELAGDRSIYLTAYSGGALSAFAKISRDRPIPIGVDGAGTQLEKIYVDAALTGSGIGRLLIKRIISDAIETGARSLWLDVLKSNERGRRFYERAGFALVGELAFATDLRQIGLWVMQHPLRLDHE